VKLKNFEISSEIELQTNNLFWDIHNFATFVGLELIPASNAVVMKWVVPKGANPWGCTENRFSGMTLYFDNLRLLTLTPRDIDMPLTEDSCLAAILKVDPNIQQNELYLRTRTKWELNDSFCLAFQFQSGRVIEIGSDTVELIPLP
jgi:hypothetical protein